MSLTVYRADPEIVGVAGWVADDVARAVWELPAGPVELEIHEHPHLPQRVFAAAGRVPDDTTMIWVYDAAGERIGGAGVGNDRGPVGPDASPDETLTIPPEPGVHPVFLHDGTPAFVVNQPNTDLRVLHAVSPHQPNGIRKAVVWCPRTERFVDPWHGSRFSVDGTWLAGPAPTGLPRYEAWIGADPTIVRIGERLAAPARPSNTVVPTPGQPGPRCDIDQDGRIRDAIVAHPPPAGAPTTVEDASDEAILYVDPMTVERGR